jgi:TonB family protein
MNTVAPRHLVRIILSILLAGQINFGSEYRRKISPRSTPSEAAWLSFTPTGEEFTAMIPGPPTLLNELAPFAYKKDGETVLQHRDFSGYGDGLVFIIGSYKARRPQQIQDAVIANETRDATFDREVTLNGLSAHQYRGSQTKFHSWIICFTTKEHVYSLTLMTLEESNPAVAKFLGSFRLRVADDKESSENLAPADDVSPQDVFNARDVTRKAVVAWKPIPGYTEQARRNQTKGTIVVEAVLAANGYVTNIKVRQGLGDGMTEKAIEYTRSLRFFPAEKDGQPVSQQLMMEYNFNLY